VGGEAKGPVDASSTSVDVTGTPHQDHATMRRIREQLGEDRYEANLMTWTSHLIEWLEESGCHALQYASLEPQWI
jgi:hypothetical protein